jgi:hypothetical protein
LPKDEAALGREAGKALDAFLSSRGIARGKRQVFAMFIEHAPASITFQRKAQPPCPFHSLQLALLASAVRAMRSAGMLHYAHEDTEGWADCLDLDAPQRINGRHDLSKNLSKPDS